MSDSPVPANFPTISEKIWGWFGVQVLMMIGLTVLVISLLRRAAPKFRAYGQGYFPGNYS
jgi:hypothetical protein